MTGNPCAHCGGPASDTFLGSPICEGCTPDGADDVDETEPEAGAHPEQTRHGGHACSGSPVFVVGTLTRACRGVDDVVRA